MRVPLSWLRELVELPSGETGRSVADRLVRAGLEVETVERVGGVDGPLVVGRVLSAAAETASNGKTVRWCQVDVGEAEPRGIVCGAPNIEAGQAVVVALPGAVLPGGFAISARKTYGHVSDGMVCSERELGLGDDHDGILVLEGAPAAGTPAAPLLGLGDEVLDIAVTPDRGYCFSLRGIAREAATAYGLAFRDPASLPVDATGGEAWPVRLEDAGCDRFVARVVEGLDPAATTPDWMAARLRACGMRPISVVVDVTNYVMLELGQPIHAYDADHVTGPLVARRAGGGSRLRTLDGAERELDPDDLVIADDSGPLGVAGVMGGASSEVSATTTRVVVEAAHFDPVAVARAARRLRLPSEASRRFERGVDPAIPEAAAQRVVDLLVAHAGGRAVAGSTVAGAAPAPAAIALEPGYVAARGGVELDADEVRRRLEQVGCRVDASGLPWVVEAPTWRPDLRDPADLVEEVLRLVGYDAVPSRLPRSVPGRGLTPGQRRRRAVGRALAAAGAVEVLDYPFVAEAELDALRLPTDDPRRRAVRLANPMSAEQPLLRTTLLPGLVAAAQRNLGRGAADLALFEVGRVFAELADAVAAPRPPVDARPSDQELTAVAAALPRQAWQVAAVLVGRRDPAGWTGPGRPADWTDAVELAQEAATAAGVDLEVRAGDAAPWHPGRCAELVVDGQVVGWAGELHPGVASALRLPARPAAFELDLDALPDAAPVQAPPVSGFPVATQDVALVVPDSVPAAAVEAALRRGAGPLLEDVRLFDVYSGEQLGSGVRSLAFALRLRAPDRTLQAAEVAAARDAAVAAAAALGATLRA